MIFNDRIEERTGFQEVAPFDPSIDLRTDFVMVYGIDETMPERIQKWEDKGYVVHLMTGVAWGEYQPYLYGKIDGREHWDEAQKDREGKIISHGEDVPYMVPTLSFTRFLIERLKVAVDTGVVAIHMEEPEFWVEGGYSEAFKREWEIYYKESWIAPHSSADAQYRASKLKAYLYKRCIGTISAELKEYARVTYNRNLRFYVPTHSLINYTQWRIVSPQSQLLDLPTVDGYIAQIWTGTSRTKNVYDGKREERTFETAFLEYGIMQELIRNTDRRMWFLHDPIEDNPNYDWEDYRKNYLKTLVASLFHPDVYHYEISPWPNRIFNRMYLTKDGKGKEAIPDDYATLLLILMNTLRDFKQENVEWSEGLAPIGVFLSDTAMFQRFNQRKPFTYDGTAFNAIKDEEEIELLNWSSFYGLAMPPLKEGMPVRPVQLDNISRYPSYLNNYKVLVLSYEFMKPQSPNVHLALSEWVRNGGSLFYVGDNSDKFHQVREWWNQAGQDYKTPAEHLFEVLELDRNPHPGIYNVQKGKVVIQSVHPAELTSKNIQKAEYKKQLKVLMEKEYSSKEKVKGKNHLLLKRGPYTIVSVLNESINEEALHLDGLFVDLFDSELPIRKRISIQPGEQQLLYDLNRVQFKNEFEIIATSARVEEMSEEDNAVRLVVKGPEGIHGRTRIYSFKKPQQIVILNKEGKNIIPFDWDDETNTLLLRYDHASDGTTFKVNF